MIIRYIKDLLRNVAILEELIVDELFETIRLANCLAGCINVPLRLAPSGGASGFG